MIAAVFRGHSDVDMDQEVSGCRQFGPSQPIPVLPATTATEHSLVELISALVAAGRNWDFSLRDVARLAGMSRHAPLTHARTDATS